MNEFLIALIAVLPATLVGVLTYFANEIRLGERAAC